MYWSEGLCKGTRLHKVAKGQFRIYQAGLISQAGLYWFSQCREGEWVHYHPILYALGTLLCTLCWSGQKSGAHCTEAKPRVVRTFFFYFASNPLSPPWSTFFGSHSLTPLVQLFLALLQTLSPPLSRWRRRMKPAFCLFRLGNTRQH